MAEAEVAPSATLEPTVVATLDTLAKSAFAGMQATELHRGLAGHMHNELATQAAVLDNVSSSFDEARQATDDSAAATHRVAMDVRLVDETSVNVELCAQTSAERLREVALAAENNKQLVARLEEERKRISAALGIIARIADQTKMLALNARIEAARAGAAGQGFTVVAGEVRSLAAETSQAADDIEESLQAFSDVVGAFAEAADHSHTATTGLASEMGELANQMSGLREVTMSTRQATETLAAAAEEHSAIVDQLSDRVAGASGALKAAVQMLDAGAQAAKAFDPK